MSYKENVLLPIPKLHLIILIRKKKRRSPLPQQVKDLALSLQHLGSLLWCGFDPWPRNFHMPRVQPKKKRRTEKKIKGFLIGGNKCLNFHSIMQPTKYTNITKHNEYIKLFRYISSIIWTERCFKDYFYIHFYCHKRILLLAVFLNFIKHLSLIYLNFIFPSTTLAKENIQIISKVYLCNVLEIFHIYTYAT